MNILDFISIIIYLVLGFVFVFLKNKDKNNMTERNLKLLLCYHLFFGLLYYYLTDGVSVDSFTYWKHAKDLTINSWNDLFNIGLGTNIIYVINYLPVNIFGLSYLQLTLMYTFMGFLGFFYLYNSIFILFKSRRIKVIKYFPIILFLPNLHFWSSAIGKDTIIFFLINVIIYASIHRKRALIFTVLLGIYLIRPHIALFLIISFGVAFLIQNKISFMKKVLGILFFIVCLGFVLPKVASFANIESLDIKNLETFAKTKSENLSRSESGSRVDTSGYPVYYKVFTFLYRPLFFDAKNIMGLIVSFENLTLIFLTILTFKSKIKLKFRKADYILKAFFVFFIIGTFVFSFTIGNLGIMIRMKNMLMPGLLIFILWVINYNVINFSEI